MKEPICIPFTVHVLDCKISEHKPTLDLVKLMKTWLQQELVRATTNLESMTECEWQYNRPVKKKLANKQFYSSHHNLGYLQRADTKLKSQFCCEHSWKNFLTFKDDQTISFSYSLKMQNGKKGMLKVMVRFLTFMTYKNAAWRNMLKGESFQNR